MKRSRPVSLPPRANLFDEYLPDELKRAIFAFLSFSDLGRVARTCREFARLMNTPADGLLYVPRAWRRIPYVAMVYETCVFRGERNPRYLVGFSQLLRFFRDRGYFAHAAHSLDALHIRAEFDFDKLQMIYDVFVAEYGDVARIIFPVEDRGAGCREVAYMGPADVTPASEPLLTSDAEKQLFDLLDGLCREHFVRNHASVTPLARLVDEASAHISRIEKAIHVMFSDLRVAFATDANVAALVRTLRDDHRILKCASAEHAALAARHAQAANQVTATYVSPFRRGPMS